MITALLLAILVLLMIGYILQIITKPKRFPPGPIWLPIVGSSNVVQKLTKIYGSQWKALSHLAKEYSTQVLGLKLGSDLVVVVYGEKNIRQVFTGTEFEGRPNSFFIRLRCFGKRMGITSADGPLWRLHRRFTVKHLKNVGFGKTAMEKEIQNEMHSILDYIYKNRKPISPKSILAPSVMNVLWKYVAGESIQKERLTLLLELVTARSKAFSMAGGWLNQFPWCRFFFPEASGYTLINRINEQISNIIEDAIRKHKINSAHGNDFIYSFLAQMKVDKDTFTEEQLKVICLDLFIAGSQTTSNVLEFALLACLRNQYIQEKVYGEIYTVIGDSTPSWVDSHKLVYTSAFLLEVQRCYPIVPLAGPRRVLSDSILDGYAIPKETTVLLSVGNLNFDPNIYNEPHEFKPERFIDEHGALKNAEHVYTFGLVPHARRQPFKNLIPFLKNPTLQTPVKTSAGSLFHIRSDGGRDILHDHLLPPLAMCLYGITTERQSLFTRRRRCPGDSLARSFIFITFVGILQKFKIQCVNGVLPNDELVIGLISSPRPFSALFVPRHL